MKQKSVLLAIAVLLLVVTAPGPALADASVTLDTGESQIIRPNVGVVTLNVTATSQPMAQLLVKVIFRSSSSDEMSIKSIAINTVPGKSAECTLEEEGYYVYEVRLTAAIGSVTVEADYSGQYM